MNKYQDKITHFLAGYFIADLAWYIFPTWALALVVAIVAAAKEFYDLKYRGTGFDWKDLAATVAGCIAFIGVKVLAWKILF